MAYLYGSRCLRSLYHLATLAIAARANELHNNECMCCSAAVRRAQRAASDRPHKLTTRSEPGATNVA